MAASTSFSFSKAFYTLPSRPSTKTLYQNQYNNFCNLSINDNIFSNPIQPIKDKSFAITTKHQNPKRGLHLKAYSSSDPLQQSPPQTIKEHDADQDGFRDSESEAGYSLKALLQVYKEAIFDGDWKTVSELEAMIYTVEKEKNELVQKVSALSTEIDSGKEKYVRLQADFENFRKRSENERLTIRNNAQGEVIESLLPMVDNFERAKQQLKLETEQEKKIDASYQGIYKQFVEIMRSLRVAAVPTVGKPFDPSVHEAIAREESQEFKEGVIIQEFRRGFLLGDRLLRPAMVKVSSGPGKKKQAPVADKSAEQPATAAGVDER